MQQDLSPPKATLLAVHFASTADIDAFRQLTSAHISLLSLELLLRILLTYLPETLDPSTYTPLLQELKEGKVATEGSTGITEINYSPVNSLSEEQAYKKARKLRLLELSHPDAPTDSHDDPLTLFLFHRAYKIEQDAGMINLLPNLLLPFVEQCDAIQTWLTSTIVPLIRRNFEYHPETSNALSISEFEKLPDAAAVDYLLSEASQYGVVEGSLGRDLRSVLGPWFYDPARWPAGGDVTQAAGWRHYMQWLVTHASRSWRVAVQAVEESNGPADVDTGPLTIDHPQSAKLDHLLHSYLRAALASAYSISDPSADGLTGAWSILSRVSVLMDAGTLGSLETEVASLPQLSGFEFIMDNGLQAASSLRNDLLDENNLSTSPTDSSITLLRGLILSALILNRLGFAGSIRSVGEMMLLQDQNEQKSEFLKAIRFVSSNAPRDADGYWVRARHELLWLHSWNPDQSSKSNGTGPFGVISRQFLESEILKAMLAGSRFALARATYEDVEDRPLTAEQIEEAVLSSAFQAFDNASNPNRTRGGLKKCDEITLAFPKTLPPSSPSITRMRALVTATHGLSNYRLVLKQGEPFTPVILRVHSDPISIIEKILEQNRSAYTRVSEFVEMSKNLAIAGLLTGSRKSLQLEDSEAQEAVIIVAERRIVAMCIEAALREDDFETAYSYVMSRLGGPSSSQVNTSSHQHSDEWSWSAALRAGQYILTQRSLQPTHLGTSSGNPEIRHLEQRLECLATALRIAPASQLLEILKTFRRCEEQLDSAIAEEAAQEEAWDAVGDVRGAPGSFDQLDPDRMYPARNITASASARLAEEAPMSLFDLSRATARIASKNLTSLSGQQVGNQQPHTASVDANDGMHEHRVRKRDQLRDAATGTLVSGVGWLIGANVQRSGENNTSS